MVQAKSAAKDAAARQRQLQAEAEKRAAGSSEAQQQQAILRQHMQLKVSSHLSITQCT